MERTVKNTREIEKLLDDLKKEIEEEGSIFEERVSFSEEPDETNKIPQKWEYCYAVDYNAPLVAHKKRLGKMEIFVKKVIRKINKFLILPIVFFQNDYNKRVQEEINKLYNIIEIQNKQIKNLEDKLDQHID